MLSITLQVNLHIAVHACQHCVGDTFRSHNQNKGHVFEDDENKATIVAQSKQSVFNRCAILSRKTVTVTAWARVLSYLFGLKRSSTV